jgi:Family of unknown function (DUF5947)
MTVVPLELIGKPGASREQQTVDLVACSALGQAPLGTPARCQLCGEWLGEIHSHLWHLDEARAVCACRGCEHLDGTSLARYRRMQPRVELLRGFEMSEAMWNALTGPLGPGVGMAFFYRTSSTGQVMARGPEAAEGGPGNTETVVDPEAWATLTDRNPVLSELESDVEALLAQRLGLVPEHYRVSIDRAHRLTGLYRSDWGMVPAAVRDFFTALRRGGP